MHQSPLIPVVYISGPMTGLPEMNYLAFHAAAEELRSAGFHVINPAENEAPTPRTQQEPTWSDWMRLSVQQVTQADGVALLPGWEGSTGACTEVFVARRLGLQVSLLQEWTMDKVSL